MQSSSVQVTMQSQNRKRAPAWTEWELLDLIAVWGEESMLSELRSKRRNAKTFQKISKAMMDRGYSRDTTQWCVKRVLTQTGVMGGRKVIVGGLRYCHPYFCAAAGGSSAFRTATVLQLPSSEGSAAENGAQIYRGILHNVEEIKGKDHRICCYMALSIPPVLRKPMSGPELRSKKRNANTYAKVSRAMTERGYSRDTEQCCTKIKELRQMYQKAREVNRCSGSQPHTCCFYRELHAIMEGDATTTPPLSMDTCKGGAARSEEKALLEDEEEEEKDDSAQMASGESVFLP
ncbi:Zinc finger and SCAN domain-containing protein 29 [Chelonia mydas]|uniref:Zinc finger and SCAN domain-containing protein 29 n=1 Tax=Chelonia mydas TaxID=8469 RepID=M7BX89_CHEMY|nr:Zinc finger and SCAN domain-containing protein 29 [Chelonia mydas]